MFVWEANTITAQTFLVDLPDPSGAGLLTAPIITDDERRLAELAISEADGKMTTELLLDWDRRLSSHAARKLAEDWEARGWLEKDSSRANARFVTPLLERILSRTPQSPQSSHSPQTGVNLLANRSRSRGQDAEELLRFEGGSRRPPQTDFEGDSGKSDRDSSGMLVPIDF
jgi:hypothetical protein